MEAELKSKQNDQEDDSFLPNGRRVCLGDLYDYTTDTVLNRDVSLCPKVYSSIKTEFDAQSKEKFTFFFRQPQLCKWLHLGIDHQQQCCMAFSANLTEGSRYWFSEYLDYHPSESTASVTLHFRFQGYKSSLPSSMINVTENVVTEGTRATHVVKEIVYGFNGLLILELPNCKPEMYQAIEDRLFLTAKCLAAKRQVPQDLLHEIQCRFYSDMPESKPQSFPLSYFGSTGLPKILKRMRNLKIQIPVYANLAPLENSEFKTCREEQRLVDSVVMFAVLQNTISTFRSDCQGLLDDPFMQRNPRTRYYLEYFLDCLEQLSNLINKTTIRYPNWNSNQVYSRLCQFWFTYFASGTIAEWILQRKMGLSVLKSLLDDIEFPFVSMASIVNLYGRKKIFMFKTNKAPDELFKQFCTDLNQSGMPEWSVLEIVAKPMEHVETIRVKLESFVKSVDENKSIQYFISSSSTEEDGAILFLNSERTTSILPMSLNNQQELVIPGTRLFSKGNPSIFLLQTDERSDTGDFRWLDLGVKTVPRHRTLLLMGATGRGKSTLVDSIINYVLGVQWTDPFRFRIEAERKNSAVTAYTVHYVNGMLNTLDYSLTIIDTPGYCGDSEKDQKTTQLVAKFLAHGNSRNIWKAVDFIGLVANETDKVSSASQNSVYEAIPALFGAGGKIPSVHWFCTFCSQSNSLPMVLEGVSPSSCIPTDHYYQFDNTALFSSNQQIGNGQFIKNQNNWKMVWDNLKAFFHRADANPTVQSVAKSSTTPPPLTAEEMESLETVRVMEKDIKDLLERLEKLYMKKPELASSKKLIKSSQETLEGEADDENQYKLGIKLMKVLNETIAKIKILKDSGINHRRIQSFKFRQNTAKACDYIRYLKHHTNPSPLRLRILDQILTWSQHLYNINNNSKICLSLVVQTSPASMEEVNGVVNESNPTVLTIVTC